MFEFMRSPAGALSANLPTGGALALTCRKTMQIELASNPINKVMHSTKLNTYKKMINESP